MGICIPRQSHIGHNPFKYQAKMSFWEKTFSMNKKHQCYYLHKMQRNGNFLDYPKTSQQTWIKSPTLQPPPYPHDCRNSIHTLCSPQLNLQTFGFPVLPTPCACELISDWGLLGPNHQEEYGHVLDHRSAWASALWSTCRHHCAPRVHKHHPFPPPSSPPKWQNAQVSFDRKNGQPLTWSPLPDVKPVMTQARETKFHCPNLHGFHTRCYTINPLQLQPCREKQMWKRGQGANHGACIWINIWECVHQWEDALCCSCSACEWHQHGHDTFICTLDLVPV